MTGVGGPEGVETGTGGCGTTGTAFILMAVTVNPALTACPAVGVLAATTRSRLRPSGNVASVSAKTPLLPRTALATSVQCEPVRRSARPARCEQA